MTRTLSPRERKLVAVAILIGLGLLAVRLVVAPIIYGFADRSEERRALRTQFAANERLAASIEHLRKTAERQRSDLAQIVALGSDRAAAGDRLRDRVQRTVEAAGGEFRGAEDANARPGWLRMRGNVRLTTAQLVTVLGELQNTVPYLVVEALTVTADPTVVAGKINPLETVIDVAIPLAPSARA